MFACNKRHSFNIQNILIVNSKHLIYGGSALKDYLK